MNEDLKKSSWHYYTLQFLQNAISILISYIEKRPDVEKYLNTITDLTDLYDEIRKEMDGDSRSNI